MKLTPRQKEVLELLRSGNTRRGVADILKISVNTVAVHIAAILSSLGARNATHAVAVAIRTGCIGLEEVSVAEILKSKPSKRSSFGVEFCEVCKHNVYDLSKHIQTEEHKRSVRVFNNTAKGTGPRLPGE